MTKIKNQKILSIEEWKELLSMLNASKEDAEIACSNIENLDLHELYHVLFVKTLSFSTRAEFIEKFNKKLTPIYSKMVKNIPDYNWYQDQQNLALGFHGSFTWENILNYILDISKRDSDFFDVDEGLNTSLVDIITYEMGLIKPISDIIKKEIKNYRL